MAMTKKAKREAKQREALDQRIGDIVAGACGGRRDDDEGFLTPEDLAKIIPAIKESFDFGEGGCEWLWAPHNLHHYGLVSDIVEFYYTRGIRA